MPFIGDDIVVRQVGDELWQLERDLVYQGRSQAFTIPGSGDEANRFRTDFASVPRAFTWLVPRYGRYTRAAILHDYLCVEAANGRFARHDADGIFRRAMRELGVSFLRRWLMWVAVRLGAGWRSLWRPGLLKGLGVLVLGLAALAFLIVPLAVVLAWLAVFWVLEWVVFPALLLVTRRKQVNRPRNLTGA